jgi:hypothetical protein
MTMYFLSYKLACLLSNYSLSLLLVLILLKCLGFGDRNLLSLRIDDVLLERHCEFYTSSVTGKPKSASKFCEEQRGSTYQIQRQAKYLV